MSPPAYRDDLIITQTYSVTSHRKQYAYDLVLPCFIVAACIESSCEPMKYFILKE